MICCKYLGLAFLAVGLLSTASHGYTDGSALARGHGGHGGHGQHVKEQQDAPRLYRPASSAREGAPELPEAALAAELQRRQGGGTCGPGAGNCPTGRCCSQFGYCGTDATFCDAIAGCQPQYGSCGTRAASPSSSSPSSSSSSMSRSMPTPSSSTPVARPPSSSTSIARSSTSIARSSTSIARSSTSTSTIATAPSPSAGLAISTNGRCGNGTTCAGSAAGPCCSEFFFCGSDAQHCGAGCKSDFGACGIAAAPQPSPGPGVSLHGMCGNHTTCAGSTFGRCCSHFWYCGSDTAHCGDGCRADFGECSGAVSPSSAAATPSSSSSTTRSMSMSMPTTSTTAAPPKPPPPSTSTTTRAAAPTVSLPPGMTSSTDGTCGNGVTCLGTTLGRCCSQFGFCGDGDQFCAYISMCQPEFGHCDPAPSGSNPDDQP